MKVVRHKLVCATCIPLPYSVRAHVLCRTIVGFLRRLVLAMAMLILSDHNGSGMIMLQLKTARTWKATD